MGLFVHLSVDFSKVNAEQWENLYFKTHSILERFPIPLLSLHVEEKLNKKRFSYSNNLIHDKDTPNEYWDIIGDFISYKKAENFRIYRNLQYYIEDRKPEGNNSDVLWANKDHLQYRDSSFYGQNIFGNKTQCFPYHLAVLAVGIILENELEGAAFVSGDIEKEVAENILPWLQKQTGTPLKLPVCFDADRLWVRIDKCYTDKDDAIERFMGLFHGYPEESLQALLKYVGYEKLIKRYAEKLSSYESLSQYGAEAIVMQVFNSRKNIQELIDFIYLANSYKKKDEKPFNFQALIKILASLFITVPLADREPLNLFSVSAGRLVDIGETFTRMFVNMKGAPKDISVFMDKQEFIDTFVKHTDMNPEEVQQIVETEEIKCYKKIEECKKVIDSVADEVENIRSHIPEELLIDISEEERYFYEEVYSQKENFVKNEKNSASILGKMLKGLLDRSLDTNPDLFEKLDKERCLGLIYESSFDNGFSLRYTAWNSIDQEANLETLKYLFVLSSIDKNEKNFWDWRIHIMENPHLWSYLVQRNQIQEKGMPKLE
ncbi:MAG: hypothetical protein KDK90_28425 [Leptospiraceae bacterium]|nr:hypothetical protein [Leptospiraceae bacterium]